MAARKKIICFAILLLLSMTWSATSFAATFEETLPKFATNNSKAKAKAIDALVATGDDRTATVLEAFLKGRLYWRKKDKKVVLVKKSGAVYVLTDPLTSKEIGQVKKRVIKKIRVNNRLRKKIRGAMGGLTLLSKNAEVRSKAADAVLETSVRLFSRARASFM